jgi:hypothetical protein
VRIATQSEAKLNSRSPPCNQSVTFPGRRAVSLRLGSSNSSKGVENSPTRTLICNPFFLFGQRLLCQPRLGAYRRFVFRVSEVTFALSEGGAGISCLQNARVSETETRKMPPGPLLLEHP